MLSAYMRTKKYVSNYYFSLFYFHKKVL